MCLCTCAFVNLHVHVYVHVAVCTSGFWDVVVLVPAGAAAMCAPNLGWFGVRSFRGPMDPIYLQNLQAQFESAHLDYLQHTDVLTQDFKQLCEVDTVSGGTARCVCLRVAEGHPQNGKVVSAHTMARWSCCVRCAGRHGLD
jgi:hypothetical protein